jgi:hypothetical protein
VRRAGERVYFGWDSSSSSGAEDNNSSMTTASELLYQRRSRAGRSAELPLSEASRRLRPSSNSHLHRFHYSDHYDPNYHHYYHCHGSLRFRNFLQRVSEMVSSLYILGPISQVIHFSTSGKASEKLRKVALSVPNSPSLFTKSFNSSQSFLWGSQRSFHW